MFVSICFSFIFILLIYSFIAHFCALSGVTDARPAPCLPGVLSGGETVASIGCYCTIRKTYVRHMTQELEQPVGSAGSISLISPLPCELNRVRCRAGHWPHGFKRIVFRMDGLPAHILSHPDPVVSWDWESLKVKLASAHLKQEELCAFLP